MKNSDDSVPFHDTSLFNDEEMSPEEEDRLWESVGREPTREEWREIALSLNKQ